MSSQDTNSMPSDAVYDNTAVGLSSTTSHSDSMQISRKQKTTLTMFSKHSFRLLPVNSMKNGQCTCYRGPDCPEKSRGKHPRISDWPENATTDLIQLAQWKKQWPDTNWAMACGTASGVWVLDIDNHKNGYESLERLEAKVGKLRGNTVMVKTGGGGLHIYFAWPADGSLITNKVDLKEYEGIDIRGEGGYVVVPPSLHRSGNRYEWIEGFDPDSIALAQAPKALIELIKTSTEYARSKDKPRDTRPWDSVPDEVIREKAPALCSRIEYFTSEAGANDVSYEDWVALASWAHAMTDDDSVFHDWSSVDKDRYSKRDTGRKWKDTADMAPRSCHRAQADHPLTQCKNCPLFELDKNPSYHVRVAYNQEQGGRGPWGAPKTTDDKTIKTINKSSQKAYNERGEGSMEVQKAANEMHDTYTQIGATAEAVIDVTEDDAEGSTTTSAGEQEQSTYQQPNFRIASDNITPLIEQSKALEEKLRSGVNGHDLLHDVAKVLAAIKRLDELRYEIELDRLVSAENAGKSRKDQKYKKTSVEAAVKSAAEREAAEILTQMTTVGEVWPDAPEEHHELPLPTGYKYSDDGVEKFVATAQGNIGFEEVSSQPSYMAGWREDITTGEIQAVIRTRTRNRGWIEVTCAPSVFGDKRQLGGLKDVGCDFPEEAIFGKYLSASYTLIRSRFGLEPELGTSRLGWHEVNDQLFFVFPEQSFGSMPIQLHTSNKAQLQQELSVSGDIEKEGEALVSMMFKYQKMAFAIGTAAASILMRPMKLSGVVDYFGFCSEYVSAQTGTGKSTTVSAAISIYGTPHGVRNFQGTQFGITQSMILRSDLPTVFQEAQAGSHNGKGNDADPGKLLHVLGDGGGKIMGTKGGGLRHNPFIYGTMLLANNENFVNPSMAKQGELQRVFTFEPPFPPNTQSVKVDQEKMMRDLSDHHGNGGREMVRKLIEVVDSSWTKLREKVEADYKVQYEAAAKVIPADVANRSMFDRRAKVVALVRIGLKYLIEYGYSLPEQVTDMLFRGVDEAFVELVRREAVDGEAVESERYLDSIKEYIMSSTSQIAYMESVDSDGSVKIPLNGYIGTLAEIDDEWHVALQAKALKAVFDQYNKSSRAIVRDWAFQRIITTEGDRLQHQATMRYPSGSSINLRFYCFRLDKLGITLPDSAYDRYHADFGSPKKKDVSKDAEDI